MGVCTWKRNIIACGERRMHRCILTRIHICTAFIHGISVTNIYIYIYIYIHIHTHIQRHIYIPT